MVWYRNFCGTNGCFRDDRDNFRVECRWCWGRELITAVMLLHIVVSSMFDRIDVNNVREDATTKKINKKMQKIIKMNREFCGFGQALFRRYVV